MFDWIKRCATCGRTSGCDACDIMLSVLDDIHMEPDFILAQRDALAAAAELELANAELRQWRERQAVDI